MMKQLRLLKSKWILTGLLLSFSFGFVNSQTIVMSNGSTPACSGNFYDSGNSGGNYVNNENYTHTITPTSVGNMVQVAFSAFNVESGWDYMYIYNGPSTASPLIGTYTGTSSPGTVLSSHASGALTFVFTTDGSVVSSGWAASISCIPPPTILISNAGPTSTCNANFYDSGNAGGNYVNNENYTHTINPGTPGNAVQAAFSSFNVEGGWDYLYIYNGPTIGSPLIGVYSGATAPGTVVSTDPSGALTFRFTTDASVVLSGWSAYISCVPCVSSDVPTLTASASNVCSGGLSTISIAGNLNGATSWNVYSGSCGGTLVGTTNTASFNVNPTATTTYFIRGEGGCAVPSACGSITINVADLVAPVADVATLADVTAECEVTSLTAPTATDNCSATVTVTNNAVLPITTQGTTVVTWTYNDGNGNLSTQTQNIVIDDVTAPVIACPADIVVTNDAGLCGAVVSFATPTATDNCGGTLPNILFVSDNADASEIPAALTAQGYTVTSVFNDYVGGDNATLQGSLSAYDLIYWHASGASGLGEVHNLATITNLNAFVAAGGNVFVTGYDVIVSPTDMDLITFLGGTYGDDVNPGYNTLVGPNSLTDGFSNIVGMTINAPNGDQDNVNGLLPGTTMVLQGSSGSGAEWSLYSNGGGEIAWVSSGQVSGSLFPSWTTLGSGYHEALLNFAFNTSNSTVAVAQTDLSGLISGDVFPVGTTTIEYTATDASGNSSICSFTVTVNDTEAPVADLVTLADVTAECEVTSLTAPTATDNCATMVTVSNDATFPITSDVTVTWTYDDGNGNTATQTQMVIIDDVTGPIADLATLADVTATCEVTSLTAPTATDNCSGMVTVSNDAIFPITSDVTVTWTYDDGNGNTTTQAQNVIIDAVDASVSVSAATITANNSNGGVTYQWVDCDNANAPIAGATGISFTATVSGNYAVEVTEGNCTEMSNCTVIDLSSIGELSANLLNVYPNPASSVMNIETSLEGTVNIFDLSGKLIYTQNAFAGKNELNVNQLATGSYTLRLTTANGTQVVRFVINRQ